MTVCKANEVRTELMDTRYLPQGNEACFIAIVPQIEKLNCGGENKGAVRLRITNKAKRLPKGLLWDSQSLLVSLWYGIYYSAQNFNDFRHLAFSQEKRREGKRRKREGKGRRKGGREIQIYSHFLGTVFNFDAMLVFCFSCYEHTGDFQLVSFYVLSVFMF